MAATYENLRNLLQPHGQEHLLAFWDDLDEPARHRLAEQISQIDLDLIDRLVRGEESQGDWKPDPYQAKAAPAFSLDDDSAEIAVAQAQAAGEEALSAGRTGAILVAGGQGSRLGFDHPKGMFPLGPISNRTLFQILVEKLRARAKRHGTRIPLYVMTSPATHEETVTFLDEHDRFGLPPEDLIIFCQGTMPAVDRETGGLLLADRGELFLSPDGHGGALAALHKHGCLENARRRGIEHLFYFQVDNPLVRVCEPELIGYHLLSGSEYTSQVVRKQEGKEKVGVIVEYDGRVGVIEYSELPDEVANRRREDGRIDLWAGSIAVHVFSVEFLERMASTAGALPLHHANKKVPHLNEQAEKVEPQEPNAIKFEQFIFDLMPHARRAVAVEADPEDVFSAVKNAPGSERETAQTAKQAMITQHQNWLRAAGANVDDGVAVEINPLFALDEDEVKQKIEPGTSICEPTYFSP